MELNDFLGYFKADLFISELKSTSRDGVIKEMVDHVAKTNFLKDSTLVLEMLKRREELGSTGIGKKIAVPHGRTVSVSTLLTVFGKTKKGIEFDAIDNEPVRMIFMIIAPPQEQSNVYLPFLGKLVELVKSENIRSALENVKTFDEFIAAMSGAQ